MTKQPSLALRFGTDPVWFKMTKNKSEYETLIL